MTPSKLTIKIPDFRYCIHLLPAVNLPIVDLVENGSVNLINYNSNINDYGK
jgi:hypothetical protein